MSTAQDRFEHIEVTTALALRDWLLAHHAQGEAVWLVTWKKAVPDKYVTTDQVLDELIAFGWIDGIRRRIDDERSRQLISPRRTQPWARSYKQRAERLATEGRMHASGTASVEQARASGMWDAMDDVDDLLVPDDLAAALRARPQAQQEFDGFPPSTRRNVLRWIAAAKTERTRTNRISATVEEAAHGRRVKSNG